MPLLHVRKPSEAPPPSRSSKSVQEQQQKYDDFISSIDIGVVGDLELESGEKIRSVKVRLRRASTRVGVTIEIWDVNGHVYFRRVMRRGRPRSS